MEKLAYLQKYSTDVSFVDFSQLTEEITDTFPEYWKAVLSAASTDLSVKILLEEWAKFSYQYGSTVAYLKDHLLEVELIFNRGKYSLLYSVRNKAGGIAYYEGKNPFTKAIPENIKLVWDKIPDSFTGFYDQLHNGWVYFASQSNGLSPIEGVIVLGDLDWGILDDIDAASLPFALENCIGFFNNGMGDYAAIDLNSSDQQQGFIWWHTKPPKLNVDIWAVIDAWTKIGLAQ